MLTAATMSRAEMRDAGRLGKAEIIERQRDADELGDDRQGVEEEEIDDAEGAPELAEALEDEPRVPDAGDRAKSQHHLLVHVEHRNQQRQRPHQRGAVVLAGLGIGAEGAGVIVAHHDDEAGAEDREERLDPVLPGQAALGIVLGDGAERTDDVAEMRLIENRAFGGRLDAGHIRHVDHLFGKEFKLLAGISWSRPLTAEGISEGGPRGQPFVRFGSFSASPSVSARSRIASQTSLGTTPHSRHSTTRW